VVDPESRARDGIDQVFFGATVDYAARDGERRTISIVGIDETDTARGYVSWIAPVARALTKAREGDVVTFRTPAGIEEIEVLEVRYVPLAPGAPPGRLG
jgi:transcription elongation factor GreB